MASVFMLANCLFQIRQLASFHGLLFISFILFIFLLSLPKEFLRDLCMSRLFKRLLYILFPPFPYSILGGGGATFGSFVKKVYICFFSGRCPLRFCLFFLKVCGVQRSFSYSSCCIIGRVSLIQHVALNGWR